MYLEEYPIPTASGCMNHLLGNGTLSLAKGDGVDPLGVAHLLGKPEEAPHRVGSGGQDEHKRSDIGHVFEERAQVDGRVLHKHGSHILNYKG